MNASNVLDSAHKAWYIMAINDRARDILRHGEALCDRDRLLHARGRRPTPSGAAGGRNRIQSTWSLLPGRSMVGNGHP